MQILLSAISCFFPVARHARAAPKNILTVRIYSRNSRARLDKHGKTLARGHVKENWILLRSFIDANILFDLDRPRYASRLILPIRNNWPSADSPSRDDTSQITEFQTRPSNFHIFSPVIQWKYCALRVPGWYYRKIRKSVRVLRLSETHKLSSHWLTSCVFCFYRVTWKMFLNGRALQNVQA